MENGTMDNANEIIELIDEDGTAAVRELDDRRVRRRRLHTAGAH